MSITYWVEAIDGHEDLTVPFPARSREEAEAWVAQPCAGGRYHVVQRTTRVGVLDDLLAEETGVRLRLVALANGHVRVEITAGARQRPRAVATLTVARVRRLTASLLRQAPRRWQPQAMLAGEENNDEPGAARPE